MSKLRNLVGALVAIGTFVSIGCIVGAYGELTEAGAYYTVADNVVYDQYNARVCDVADEEWQSWIEQLHTELIRDTLTGAEAWEAGNCQGRTIVLKKWGQLMTELNEMSAKDAYYEFAVEDVTRTFKLTDSTVEWLKVDLANDLKQAINEGLVPYTFNVYVPYTSDLTEVSTLDLKTCENQFSYSIHPILGEFNSTFINDTSKVLVTSLGGSYGVNVSDAYVTHVSTLRDTDVYIPREDIKALSATYVKDADVKNLNATAVIASRIPIKMSYSDIELSNTYVDITKKTLVVSSKVKPLSEVGLTLDNFYTEKGFAYSNRYKEAITNGVNTLPTGDFLDFENAKSIGKITSIKYPAVTAVEGEETPIQLDVTYLQDESGNINVVANDYGLCIIIPSGHINFDKLVTSLGKPEIVQNLSPVQNGDVAELAKKIYQGLGGSREDWDSYMVNAGFQEAEGFNFGIIIFIVVAVGIAVGAVFVLKKVRKSMAERKEIENSYTNVLTGKTTKIENETIENIDKKTDKKVKEQHKAEKQSNVDDITEQTKEKGDKVETNKEVSSEEAPVADLGDKKED